MTCARDDAEMATCKECGEAGAVRTGFVWFCWTCWSRLVASERWER